MQLQVLAHLPCMRVDNVVMRMDRFWARNGSQCRRQCPNRVFCKRSRIRIRILTLTLSLIPIHSFSSHLLRPLIRPHFCVCPSRKRNLSLRQCQHFHLETLQILILMGQVVAAVWATEFLKCLLRRSVAKTKDMAIFTAMVQLVALCPVAVVVAVASSFLIIRTPISLWQL